MRAIIYSESTWIVLKPHYTSVERYYSNKTVTAFLTGFIVLEYPVKLYIQRSSEINNFTRINIFFINEHFIVKVAAYFK